MKQVLKGRAFWHIALGQTFGIVIVIAIITHIMPYLSSIGITRSTSSLVASAMPLLSIGGRFCSGWLGDKFDKRWIWAIALAIRPLGLLCFVYAAEWTWLLVPFIILFGTSWGGSAVMVGIVPREYFGRSHYGAILGFMLCVMSFGYVIGPPLAGWVYDTSGSYQTIWLAFIALAIVATIIVATMPPPPAKTQMIDKV